MKYLIILLLVLFITYCANESIVITAKVIYVEPFPFGTKLGHPAIDYMQAAWIMPINSEDSLAVLFDYNTSSGDDITKKVSFEKYYTFRLKKISFLKDKEPSFGTLKTISDSIKNSFDSLPVVQLVDSALRINTTEYWLVQKIENN